MCALAGQKTETMTDNQNAIDTAASVWVVRCNGTPLTADAQQELHDWLQADPRNESAFAEAQTAWRLMGLVPPPDVAKSEQSLRRPATLPASVHAARKIRFGGRRVVSIAACCMLLLATLSFWLGNPVLFITADYRTAPGEHRLITLDDGSTVDLGPGSALAVQFTNQQRRVKLLSGLAYFTVAPGSANSSRPFLVTASNGTAQALGTQFIVAHLPEAVAVTVIEHTVKVQQPGQGSHCRQAVLNPGQSVRYTTTGLGPVHDINPDYAASWRRNRLVFDRAPLEEAVNELNRYRHGKILITDSKLASRRISGVFNLNDPDTILKTIVQNLHLRSLSIPPFVTLLY